MTEQEEWLKAGDIIAAKSIEHREVVEMREDKNGKQKPQCNRYGFKFQPEHDLLSKVGVFLFLGVYPEERTLDERERYVREQLERLGFCRVPEMSNDERADMRARFGSWYQRQDFSARTCEAAFAAGYQAGIGDKP